MTRRKLDNNILTGHRVAMIVTLCLFGLCMLQALTPARRRTPKPDDRVYLVHADELYYDMYGDNPDAQIVKGSVHFMHQGANLWCDSAFYYEATGTVKAFGHVRFKQGDTLSLTCNRAYYDGVQQIMDARENVVLTHRRQTLYTDSLSYDRLYKNAYFFEGGTLIDGKDRLTSDWGEYNTGTRVAVFYYDVRLTNGERDITTDTLYYDTRTSIAHLVGPSRIVSKTSTIDTYDGYFNTKSDKAELYGRSKVVDKQKTIIGDSLFHNDKTGISEGYGNVVYVDTENQNELLGDYLIYNEQTGEGYATQNALVKDFSQGDTLYVHADSLKLYTFNINTDSVYRKVHCFNHVSAYRTDVQAICDSLVINSLDSCMTMYKDPIVWNERRQLLGEVIKIYMNDSTVRMAHIIGQALSVEKVDEDDHYNQVSSKEMMAFFDEGVLREVVSIGNVQVVYFPIDDKDSTLIGLNYTETDTMRMYLTDKRKLEKIWMPKAKGTLYPMTQIPPGKTKLSQFAWFEEIRPMDKDDIFVWHGKGEENMLKVVERHAPPLQTLTPLADEKEEEETE